MLTIKLLMVFMMKIVESIWLRWILTTCKDSCVSFAVQHQTCRHSILKFFPQNGQVSSPLLNPANKIKNKTYHVVPLIFSNTSILILFFMTTF